MTKVSNLFLQKKQTYGSKIREVSEENQQEYLTKKVQQFCAKTSSLRNSSQELFHGVFHSLENNFVT